ncbi:tRNA1(Val) (adenine(37)-N6)-methyltransferase [Flavobacterium silvaticum]|uniref:tRNA1(Val) (adenine(37)-N6)-methyltransferase n=1 Tax=Flavobacterium silvaticum TaxID=1852020 RepID=A0A972FMM6_9FLAO|nr:methyltransferase [Flavobacterium silvaticum]NMH28518.1 methyltransferase [Flavobacterium silvaticum]
MFRFKNFSVSQTDSAHKVGTDGVLLGAWAPVDNDPFSILDIGTGTGLIALMLAQRTDAEEIEALEIDDASYEEAVSNFENSPWNDRLFCFHASLDDFMEELEDQEYDLIVCNPPFYSETVSSGNTSRDNARQLQSMPFEDLIGASAVLLSKEGVLCVIIPFKEEENFIRLAAEENLFPNKITRVKGTVESEIKRSLIAFSRFRSEVKIDELVVEISRHMYTEDYRKLTDAFFLKK